MKKLCFISFILCFWFCFIPTVAFSQVSCTPGETQECFCPDGTTAIQSCRTDGNGWNQCDCTYYSFWCNPTTNLCWQDPQKDAYTTNDPGLTQPDAVRYCEEVVFAGYDDWQLPNIDELRTLIRGNPPTETGGECPVTEGSPMADGSNEACMASTEFGGPGIGGCYWSPELTGTCNKPDPAAQGHPLETCSATVASDNEHWVGSVLFDNGAACFNHLNSYADVRCVRNAPSPPVMCAEGPPESCTRGETRQCTCTNGKTGAQVCADDGSCFGPCACIGFTPSPPPTDVCDQCDQVKLTIKVPEKLNTPPKVLMAFLYSTEGWTFPPNRPPDGGTDYDQVIDPDIDVDKPLELTVPGCTYYRESCLSGNYYLYVSLLMDERMPPIPKEGEYWWGMSQEPITLGSGQREEFPMEVMLVPVADLPPEITDGPFISIDLTPLSTNSEEPTTVRADQSIIWTWSDYMLACTSDPTIQWEYKPLGSGSENWTTYTIWPDQQGGGAQKPDAWTNPMGMLESGAYEFRISMSDCAEQTTTSEIYYITVDHPPQIPNEPVRTSDETPLSTDSANPTLVEANDQAIVWTYGDDYASCSDVSPRPRILQWSYRPLDGDWITYTIYPDGQGGGTFWWWVWADTTLIGGSETVEFKVSVTDCTGQTVESDTYYIVVAD